MSLQDAPAILFSFYVEYRVLLQRAVPSTPLTFAATVLRVGIGSRDPECEILLVYFFLKELLFLFHFIKSLSEGS